MRRRLRTGHAFLALALLTGPGLASSGAAAELPFERGLDKIRLELLAADTGLCALVVAAHPGDLDGALLAYLRRVQGIETHVCFLTRGEAHENLAGPETGAALAVLRTREAEAAAAMLGAKAWYLNLPDPGPVGTAEAAFAQWNREDALRRLVRLIRVLKPEIVIVLSSAEEPPDREPDRDGLSPAVAQLAQDAFEAAYDEKRFPKQVVGQQALQIWAVQKLYRTTPRREGNAVALDVRASGPFPAGSLAEIGDAAEQRLASYAGAGAAGENRPPECFLAKVIFRPKMKEGPPGQGFEPLLFPEAAIPRTLPAPLDGKAPDEALRAPPAVRGSPRWACAELTCGEAATLGALLWAEDSTKRLRQFLEQPNVYELHVRARRAHAHVQAALAEALRVKVEAQPGAAVVTSGEGTDIRVRITNDGPMEIKVEAWRLASEPGWELGALALPAAVLKPGQSAEATAKVKATDQAYPSVPPEKYLLGREQAQSPVWVEARVGVASPVAVAPGAQPTRAEIQLPPTQVPLNLAPAFDARIEPDPVLVVDDPDHADKDLVLCRARLVVTSYQRTPWKLYARLAPDDRLQARMEKDAIFDFQAPGQEVSCEFRFMAPAALFNAGDLAVPTILWTKDYRYASAPVARFRRLPLKLPAPLRVGVVRGPSAAAWNALQVLAKQVNAVTVLDLTPERLRDDDLKSLDTILLEPGAARARPAVVLQAARLQDYLKGGGNVVCLSGADGELALRAALSPAPLAGVARLDTAEKGVVKLLKPAHPLLTRPCKIWEKDFTKWTGEFAAGTPETWGEECVALVSYAPPGQKPVDGGLLVAPVGQGDLIFVTLSLPRQWRAGVPGAYRLLANLVSGGRAP